MFLHDDPFPNAHTTCNDTTARRCQHRATAITWALCAYGRRIRRAGRAGSLSGGAVYWAANCSRGTSGNRAAPRTRSEQRQSREARTWRSCPLVRRPWWSPGERRRRACCSRAPNGRVAAGQWMGARVPRTSGQSHDVWQPRWMQIHTPSHTPSPKPVSRPGQLEGRRQSDVANSRIEYTATPKRTQTGLIRRCPRPASRRGCSDRNDGVLSRNALPITEPS